MFTGLVETVGSVQSLEELEGAKRFTIRAPHIAQELREGDSVSVDGACLTVVGREADAFSVEAVATTLSRTVAGTYREGSRVNLERALRLGDRLGGHLVQGHVDGVGRLLNVEHQGEYHLMDFTIPAQVDEVSVLYGSITLNGVSLTVNALPGPGRCQVAIIPITWERTNLSALEPGDGVNVEGDLIGKHVGRILAVRGQGDPAAPMDLPDQE